MYYETEQFESECVSEELDDEVQSGLITMAATYAQLSVAFGRSAACMSAPTNRSQRAY